MNKEEDVVAVRRVFPTLELVIICFFKIVHLILDHPAGTSLNSFR